MSDKDTREQLKSMLTKENAHVSLEKSLTDFPEKLRGKKLAGYPHTAWEILEHIRICQWDILEFSRDPEHVSPEWPKGYWPAESEPPDEFAWDKSVARIIRDLNEFVRLLEDDASDLFEVFKHGDGQTLFREACVLAKHNSYHLGQLLVLKKGL